MAKQVNKITKTEADPAFKAPGVEGKKILTIEDVLKMQSAAPEPESSPEEPPEDTAPAGLEGGKK